MFVGKNATNLLKERGPAVVRRKSDEKINKIQKIPGSLSNPLTFFKKAFL
jgi:hypothetical protein